MQILRFEHCELCKYSIASSICFLFHFYVFFMAFYTWLWSFLYYVIFIFLIVYYLFVICYCIECEKFLYFYLAEWQDMSLRERLQSIWGTWTGLC